MGVDLREGRAKSAPELSSCELVSWVQWCEPLKAEGESRAGVRFDPRITVRAIPWANRGRRCSDRSVGRARGQTDKQKISQWENIMSKRESWADMTDDEDEQCKVYQK